MRSRGRNITRAGRFTATRRGELGLTQQELADAAEVDVKTINSLERGARWPIAKNRAAIERVLRLPAGHLEQLAEERTLDSSAPARPVGVVHALLRRWFVAELDRRNLAPVELVAPLDTLRSIADANNMTLGEVLVEAGLVSADELKLRPAGLAPASEDDPIEEFRRAFVNIRTSPHLSPAQRRELEGEFQKILGATEKNGGDV
ncbi:helix-turn-helix transcriptional regulator [Nonomuraea sp. NPDC050328]|uniref:helix-turn-helix transcriptional regulator n=1 Tax=Nonomuraea sp. NPDC050328 TaxID=3364361 RepID=UPI0037B76264